MTTSSSERDWKIAEDMAAMDSHMRELFAPLPQFLKASLLGFGLGRARDVADIFWRVRVEGSEMRYTAAIIFTDPSAPPLVLDFWQPRRPGQDRGE